jgi:Na+/H+ antiporter NhaD/arsenite permease-like protein
MFLPFIGLLFSIAVGPIVFHKSWHKILPFASCFWILMTLAFCFELEKFLETIFHEYIPFIILMSGLFFTSHGIHLKIDGHAKPLDNALMLLVLSIMSSFVGTAGASLVGIRPFLHANRGREDKVHLAIFFIIIVSNIGGVLSPLGDPPLFMGFLKGIPFFWPLQNLLTYHSIALSYLLVLFFVVDKIKYKNLKKDHKEEDTIKIGKISGTLDIFFLILIMSFVLISGFFDHTKGIHIGHLFISYSQIFRDSGIFLVSIISYIKRKENFSIEPIKEIAITFVAIFITLVPLQKYLSTFDFGAMSVKKYFWGSGILSAVLDNAPTYLLFFYIAGGNPETLINSNILIAISISSVYMGAMTYIGNAPNLMIKSIASHHHIKMPNFFSYVVYSMSILVPILFLVQYMICHI